MADVAWYFATAGLVPHPVKKKMPNGRGLYDPVRQYVGVGMGLLSIEHLRDGVCNRSKAPSTGLLRVIRGGSYVHMDGRRASPGRRDVSRHQRHKNRFSDRQIESVAL